MTDQLWQALRYLLIVAGTYLVTAGKLPATDPGIFADTIIQAIGALMTLSSMAWGIYVRFRTKSVSLETGRRPDVPTLSPLTGAVE